MDRTETDLLSSAFLLDSETRAVMVSLNVIKMSLTSVSSERGGFALLLSFVLPCVFSSLFVTLESSLRSFSIAGDDGEEEEPGIQPANKREGERGGG